MNSLKRENVLAVIDVLQEGGSPNSAEVMRQLLQDHDTLQSRLESLEKVKTYSIGEATNRIIFKANGIENVGDMQRVFDTVEVALESLEKGAEIMRSALEDIASGEVTRSFCRGPFDSEQVELATADDMINRAAGALSFIDTAMQSANKGE